MFEAAYFPGNKYFNEVPFDQSTKENFKNADLLLTHHRQLISEQDKTVKLKFHHAFAMVQVKVKLPVSEFPDQGMFPENALKGVYMRAMLRNYEVDYSGVIDNDALRTVRVPKNDEALPVNNPKRKNIQMYCSSRTAPTPETDTRFIIRFYFTENDGFWLFCLNPGYRTFVYDFFSYHFFHIRVPLSARRTFAYPLRRLLSAVAAHINRFFFCHKGIYLLNDWSKIQI